MKRLVHIVFLCLAIAVAGVACNPAPRDEVVVYTALDEFYARPILDAFEAETGIRVRAQYDTEASKTTGLVNRILSERNRPRADVFWNNEVAQTLRLKDAEALEAYLSPNAAAIPEAFRDDEGYWTGFAARARVIIYNTELMDDPPRSIHDLADPKWSGQTAIALPLYGTTATHAAALFAYWGEEEAEAFFLSLLENDVAILAGNATVRDRVADGEYAFGLTDTDDANGAVLDGRPVAWVLPDTDDLGTLLIPNTASLVRGGPNPDNGRRLIDYLLSAEVEARLAESRSLQIPLNPAVKRPEAVPAPDAIRTMAVSFEEMAASFDEAAAFVREHMVR